MSIVERAADLLASTPQVQEKPAAAREGDSLGPDLIERAASHDSQRLDSPVDKGPTGGEDAKIRPAHASRKVSPTLRINLDTLRQQNIITPDSQRTPMAECFRRVKRHILANVANNSKAEAGANLVMVTSALPGEGKTFCSVNLAISIAMERDRTVLLVDADVAKPSLQRTLGLNVEKGLMDVLLDGQIDVADVLCKTDIGNLTLLPAGTQHNHATELLASNKMHALLREMAERYRDRIIIFDSPPLLAASEAGVLASQMGQILVITEAGRTTETVLQEALRRVESGKVMGVLLNKGAPPGGGFDGYGYGYGYGYGHGA